MTLAVEGHLVKVHKNVVSLVSPYLKELISSIPCDHPIIFLTDISHEVLGLIVEYIYTGEVEVPLNILQPFLKAASQLLLLGLNELSSLQVSVPQTMGSNNNVEPSLDLPEVVPTTFPDMSKNINLNEIQSSKDSSTDIIQKNLYNVILNEVDIPEIPINIDRNLNLANNLNVNDPTADKDNETPNIMANITVSTDYKHQQYSISNRGSLQLILNRYIYLMHHQSHRGFKRRWRCTDYRRKRCKAFVDTEGDLITKRLNVHNHPFHDDKIMKKVKSNLIYASIKSIEVKKKEHSNIDAAMEEFERDS
ncbi:protein abrupt-like isoform X2 [Zerene cesonia]|nr:protein abrupt-like isoform X2 [Zerene cesonia]